MTSVLERQESTDGTDISINSTIKKLNLGDMEPWGKSGWTSYLQEPLTPSSVGFAELRNARVPEADEGISSRGQRSRKKWSKAEAERTYGQLICIIGTAKKERKSPEDIVEGLKKAASLLPMVSPLRSPSLSPATLRNQNSSGVFDSSDAESEESVSVSTRLSGVSNGTSISAVSAPKPPRHDKAEAVDARKRPKQEDKEDKQPEESQEAKEIKEVEEAKGDGELGDKGSIPAPSAPKDLEPKKEESTPEASEGSGSEGNPKPSSHEESDSPSSDSKPERVKEERTKDEKKERLPDTLRVKLETPDTPNSDTPNSKKMYDTPNSKKSDQSETPKQRERDRDSEKERRREQDKPDSRGSRDDHRDRSRNGRDSREPDTPNSRKNREERDRSDRDSDRRRSYEEPRSRDSERDRDRASDRDRDRDRRDTDRDRDRRDSEAPKSREADRRESRDDRDRRDRKDRGSESTKRSRGEERERERGDQEKRQRKDGSDDAEYSTPPTERSSESRRDSERKSKSESSGGQEDKDESREKRKDRPDSSEGEREAKHARGSREEKGSKSRLSFPDQAGRTESTMSRAESSAISRSESSGHSRAESSAPHPARSKSYSELLRECKANKHKADDLKITDPCESSELYFRAAVFSYQAAILQPETLLKQTADLFRHVATTQCVTAIKHITRKNSGMEASDIEKLNRMQMLQAACHKAASIIGIRHIMKFRKKHIKENCAQIKEQIKSGSYLGSGGRTPPLDSTTPPDQPTEAHSPNQPAVSPGTVRPDSNSNKHSKLVDDALEMQRCIEDWMLGCEKTVELEKGGKQVPQIRDLHVVKDSELVEELWHVAKRH